LIVENTVQTNGILIDEQWCKFFHENKFLVGISIDGPRSCHDAFRKDKHGNSVFDKVTRSLKLLQKHDVDFNVLCTVNSVNSEYPMEVYRFFRDELKAQFLQFIPVVEYKCKSRESDEITVTKETVSARQYGNFLNCIFDEWIEKDVGSMFVQLFEGVLASYVYGRSSLCIFQPNCGRSLIMEHNGDLYSCDHFVDKEHLLGNIGKKSMINLINSHSQQEFGLTKFNNLSSCCKECTFLFTCFGECPKNRIIPTPDKKMKNWLCDGLKQFFSHTKDHMQIMANYIKQGKTADMIMSAQESKVIHR
jgi:uncharacterized protein